MWLSPLKCLRFRLQNRRTGTFRSERHTTLYSTRNISQTPTWNAQKWMKKGNKKKENFTRQADQRENFGALGDLVIQDTSVRLQEASPFVNKELYVISLICPRNKLDACLLLPLFHRAENCSSLVPLICMFENKKSVFLWITMNIWYIYYSSSLFYGKRIPAALLWRPLEKQKLIVH